MCHNGCIVAASFITLHYFSRTLPQIKPLPTGVYRSAGKVCVCVCVCVCTSVWVRASVCCLRALVTPFSRLWNAIMSPDELVKASAVQLSLTPHLGCSSWPVPLLASPHAGHNRNSLVPSSSLHHSHLSQLYFPANYLVVRAPNAT